MSPWSRGVVGLLALALVLAAGCSRINPRYCDSATPCDEGVCNAATNRCETDVDCSDGSCVCGAPLDCPRDHPVCDGEACASCTADEVGDLTCAMRDDGHPACVAGGCAECRDGSQCTAAAPHCDAVDHTCGPCQRDTECASQVCDEAAGACVEAAHIIYVDGEVGTDGAACGTSASPCKTIGYAIGLVDPSRRTLAVNGGSGAGLSYVEPLRFDGGTLGGDPVRVVGIGASRPAVIGLAESIVTAAGTSLHLTIERLDLQTTTSTSKAGVDCTDATVALDNVSVTGCSGLGIRAIGCNLTLLRSVVQDNDHGGVVLLASTSFTLANDILVQNGIAADSGAGGLDINDSTGSIEFLTVMDNETAVAGKAAGIACASATDLVVRNSVVRDNRSDGAVANLTPEGSCHYAFSDLEGAIPAGLDEGDNRDADPVFRALGLYRLSASSPCIDKGDPNADVDDDIDGEARPTGTAPDLGADEFVPGA